MRNLLLLFTCLWGVGLTSCNILGKEPKPQAISVTCQTFGHTTFVDDDDYVGTLKAKSQAIIKAENEGKISQILVNPGEKVAVGTPIVLLESGSRIKAPISGVITEISVNLGEFVTKGQELTSIVDNQTLNLNINVPAESASKLKIGFPVEIIDSQENVLATSKIDYISPEIDSRTSSLLAKASVRNDGSLRNNEYVRARIVWGSEPGVLIPATSVARLAGEVFVYVVKEQEKENGKVTLVAKQRPVRLGDIQGNKYRFVSGLKAGEKFVVSRILNLRDGASIKC